MTNEVERCVADLPEPDRSRIAEITAVARKLVPAATDGSRYGMPALLYKGNGLIAVMRTKKHIAIYPFGNLGQLADAAAAARLETTTGSVHLGHAQRLPGALLESMLQRRMEQIERSQDRDRRIRCCASSKRDVDRLPKQDDMGDPRTPPKRLTGRAIRHTSPATLTRSLTPPYPPYTPLSPLDPTNGSTC